MVAERQMFPSVRASISMKHGKISWHGNFLLWIRPIRVEPWNFHVKDMQMIFSRSMSAFILNAPMLKYRWACYNLLLSFFAFLLRRPIVMLISGKWRRASRRRHIREICGRFKFFYGEVRDPLKILLPKSFKVAKCSLFCQLPLPPIVSVNTNKLMNSLTFNWGNEKEKDFRLPSVVCIKSRRADRFCRLWID